MYKYILFDLDGTLVDSSEGILNSAKYGLEQCGIDEDNIEKLRRFIGPPLKDAFITLYGMDTDTANQAVKEFRSYYSSTGIHQCKLYEGIEHLLVSLKQAGMLLIVATSKPTTFSETILDELGISKYFDGIVGSNLDNTRSKKSEVINYILENYEKVDKGQVVMIGDKSHDLIGAEQCGISAIGVTYGFGSLEELQEQKYETIVDSCEELIKYLLG